MKQLIPENVSKKIDSLGRITIPKGLRDRMFIPDYAELDIYTAKIDGKQCICLALPVDTNAEVEAAIKLLEANGYAVNKQSK